MKTLFKLLILITLPLTLNAFHDHEEKQVDEHEHISFVDSMLNATENHLKYAYDQVNYFSKYLDETLTGEKSDYKYKNSSIKVETYYTYKETKDNKAGVTFRVKLRLPQLKEKLKLVIENDDNKVGQKYDDNNETTPYKDDDTSLALQYDKYKKYLNLKTKAGVKVKADGYVFINAQVSKKFDLTQTWSFTAEEKIEFNTDKNFENITTMSFNKRINNRLKFANTNQYYWNEEDRDDNVYNSLRLMHKLSSKGTLNYVTAVASNDNETHFQTKAYDAYVSYKHYIRKWLYYDIVPGLYWERDDDFEMRYAFRFSLGILVAK